MNNSSFDTPIWRWGTTQNIVQAATLNNISVRVLPADIQQYVKTGNDSVLNLTSGGMVLVKNFCTLAAKGEGHFLVLADGTVVNPVPGDEAAAVAGPVIDDNLIALGIVGLGAGLLATGGGGGDQTDGTDPTDGNDGQRPGRLDPILADNGLLGTINGNHGVLGWVCGTLDRHRSDG